MKGNFIFHQDLFSFPCNWIYSWKGKRRDWWWNGSRQVFKKQWNLWKFQIIWPLSRFARFTLSSNIQSNSNNLCWSTLHKVKVKVHRKTLEGEASPCQRSRGEQPRTGWWLAGSDCRTQTSNLSPCKEEEEKKSFHNENSN